MRSLRDDSYELENLIKRLEEIKEMKDGYLNLPRAILSLAQEVKQCKAALHERKASDHNAP